MRRAKARSPSRAICTAKSARISAIVGMSGRYDTAIRVGPPIAIEWPHFAHGLEPGLIEVDNEGLLRRLARLGYDLADGIDDDARAEIGAVIFDTDAVHAGDEDAVGNRVAALHAAVGTKIASAPPRPSMRADSGKCRS